MRKSVHNAVIGARELLDRMIGNVVSDSSITDDEMLSRYMNEHRGNPDRMRAFVMENAPPGADVMKEANRYSSAMEYKLKKRQVK